MEEYRTEQEGDTSANDISFNSTTGAIDSLGTPVNGPRESTRLPRQVESNVEVEQVGEDVPCDASNRILGDTGKDGVTELGEESCSYSSESIYTPSQSLSSWE